MDPLTPAYTLPWLKHHIVRPFFQTLQSTQKFVRRNYFQDVAILLINGIPYLIMQLLLTLVILACLILIVA